MPVSEGVAVLEVAKLQCSSAFGFQCLVQLAFKTRLFWTPCSHFRFFNRWILGSVSVLSRKIFYMLYMFCLNQLLGWKHTPVLEELGYIQVTLCSEIQLSLAREPTTTSQEIPMPSSQVNEWSGTPPIPTLALSLMAQHHPNSSFVQDGQWKQGKLPSI